MTTSFRDKSLVYQLVNMKEGHVFQGSRISGNTFRAVLKACMLASLGNGVLLIATHWQHTRNRTMDLLRQQVIEMEFEKPYFRVKLPGGGFIQFASEESVARQGGDKIKGWKRGMIVYDLDDA